MRHIYLFGISVLLVAGCSSDDEGEGGTQDMAVDVTQDVAPDVGAPDVAPDEGVCPPPAACPPAGGTSQCLLTDEDGCGACLWTCTTSADCPGGAVSTDGGMVGVCHECVTLAGGGNVCKPVDDPGASGCTTTAEAGYPCPLGCTDGSTCIVISGQTPAWTMGFCSPSCEAP